MTEKNYKRVRCWRCDRPLIVDITNARKDSRGRILITCRSCDIAIDKLDRKGL